jgi:glycerophosphoryl diester phosphodiesterase
LRDGADGLELDLRATKDGVIVLLHDATLDRTTNGTGALAERTLDEVRSLDAGAWFDALYSGERVPTLDEVLDELAGRVALDLEVKELLPEDALRAVDRRLHAPRARELVFASSFRLDVLEQLRALAPVIRRGLLLDRGIPPPELAQVRELDLSCLIAHEASIDAGFADACRSLALPLHTFTVNDAVRAQELARLGVDIVITDDPRALRDGCGGSSEGTGSSPEGG